MKVLELYSGIGGMHLALLESGIEADVIVSIDINTTANKVYKHNFPDTLVLNRNIESLTSKYINKLGIDVILMSPPCQPFTRNGLKEDIEDCRSQSFQHLLNILPELKIQSLLIENVKGFETSQMRKILISTLQKCYFEFNEYILSPHQFGIPNSRHRYYCLARKTEKVPVTVDPLIERLSESQEENIMYSIKDILDDKAFLEDYTITDEVLLKRALTFDICYSDSTRSCCFTKSYGRYVTGTGSIYTSETKEDVDRVYKKLETLKDDPEGYLRCIKRLHLRFFTPLEVCRLMGFPERFNFPEIVTDKQKYMLLGNSINVKVVSRLIKILNN